ncbi:MAG: hypothetical protein FWG30_09785 [Eubacteriaceae bacterium]|nr:hypothetical protein [Eubacteriaceae bacterium]
MRRFVAHEEMESANAALAYIELIKANQKKSREEYEAFKEWLASEADRLNTSPLTAVCAPKLYSEETDAHFKYIAETAHSVLSKVCIEYLKNPEFRAAFGFSKELEELIAAPCPYPDLIPMLRADIFYDESTGMFKFVEFNTDGSSGMYEESVIAGYIQSTKSYEDFTTMYDLRRYELFGLWVDTFLGIYKSTQNAKASPTVAIVDFLESGVSEEFEVFRNRFEQAGCNSYIIDIRDLAFDGEAYVYNGVKIDAIYRRAVTGEMMEKSDQIPSFLEGARTGKPCIIGHLRTQTAHVKTVFSVLRSKGAQSLFTVEESEFIAKHIPFTTSLTSSEYDYNEVLLSKDNWVVKPTDLYASRDVTLGIGSDECHWRKKVEEGVNKKHLLQEYIKPYESPNCIYKNGNLYEGSYGAMIGLYAYNGRYSGMFTRLGQNPIISSEHGGHSVSSMVVSEKN